VGIEPGEIFIGGGLYLPTGDQLKKIRKAIVDDPEPFLSIVNSRQFRKAFGGIEGEKLQRAPLGYAPDHPLIEHLKHKQFYVGVESGPEPALKAASDATRTIPIVCVALNYDPVERGYATSLARPGRNITGVFFRNPEIGPKQLEFLRQAIPRASRVGVLWTGFSADQVPPLDAEASRLRLRLEKIKLDPPYDIEGTFAALKARGVDVVLAVGDPVLYRERGRIARAGLARGLAVVGGNSGVEVGFLMGFGPDLDATVKRGAEYVDAIFRGGKVAEMPIEQPTKFELKINLKTAKALGITIPKPLLLRADEVIQ
jgi:putative ABC transport system substrate-binding protein